jgi:predicted RNA-binding Zn-ribbon protein involved in translation (DUF1610 family)
MREGSEAITCSRCHAPMTDVGDSTWFCYHCSRIALTGESEAQTERREAERLYALSLLDAVLDTEQRRSDRKITSEMESTMGQVIQTTGCPKCGGTMYRTVDTDKNGNPTGGAQYVCGTCGHVM